MRVADQGEVSLIYFHEVLMAEKSDKVPFKHKVPKTDKNLQLLRQLHTDQWRLALWSLYLASGVYVPKSAKSTTGAVFGPCDEGGAPCDLSEATHLGWSLDGEVA